MKINLETVRGIFREHLGYDSFVAGFVKEVEATESIPTAAITKDGKLLYNPSFVDSKVKSKSDLFSLLFHEVLHIAFQSFIQQDAWANVAADAIINAVISLSQQEASNHGQFFKRLYKKTGIEGLLRPDSTLESSRFHNLYYNLYGWYGRSSYTTTGEVIQTLKILLPSPPKAFLLGNHGGKSGEESLPSLGKEIEKRISSDIEKAVKEGKFAGTGTLLQKLLLEALRTQLSIQKKLLLGYMIDNKLDKFRAEFRQRKSIVSPIPLYPSKRDLVLLATGNMPLYFHNVLHRPKDAHFGLAIYLDVSGSVNEYLPKILGILRHLQNEIASIYQFSTEVVETEFSSLLKGKVETTYGTDFNCIAESILENKYRKAVVITDGYAYMNRSLSSNLEKAKVKILTIIFGKGSFSNPFAKFGEVISLEDATSNR